MSTRRVWLEEWRKTPWEWWGAAGASLAIGILLMALPISVSAYGDEVSCGSTFSTLDHPFDFERVADGDSDACAEDLADRGSKAVTALILAGFTGLVGIAARRWRRLVVPAIGGGLVILHLAWPMTAPTDDPNSDGLRCGSPLLTSTQAIEDRAGSDDLIDDCANARANRLSRGVLVGVLAIPLSIAVVSRRRTGESS